MRTISDQCAFREVVPGVGAFPSKVLSSCSLRSSVNMILLRIRSLNRSSHRSNLRNLPSHNKNIFSSLIQCGIVRGSARWSWRGGRGSAQKAAKETKTDQELSSRHDHTIARSLVCPSASVPCPPVFQVHHFQTLLNWIKSRSAISI